jgi:hypothetical protein
MNKNDKENSLEASAKMELQKLQQLVENDDTKIQLESFIDDKLHHDIVLRDDLQNEDREVSDTLLDRIDGRQEALDSIRAEVSLGETEMQSALVISNIALEELRKVNPQKASEIENSVRLKNNKKKSNNIRK